MSQQLFSRSLSNSMVKSSPECAPSVEEVISNQDLLFEILLRVPVRSLMCLILVSKQWLSLITSNSFSILHRRRRRTTAIFLHSEFLLMKGYEHMKFIHLDLDCVNKNKNHRKFSSDNNPFRSSTFSHDPFYPKGVCVVQSCHGLLLCRSGILVSKVNHHQGLFYYYVYNPTTNQVVTIDRIWDSKIAIHASVLCYEPAKAPYFKVVFCVNISPEHNPKQRQIEIYTSETGTWKVSNLVPAPGLFTCYCAYFEGCIYWLTEENTMCSYDVNEERQSTLPKPPRRRKFRLIRRYLYFGESAGHLHLAEVLPCATSLDVYELNCDRSGWFLKYEVDLTRLAKVFPEMTNNKRTIDDEYAFAVLSLVRRREDFNEDSVLVLEIPGKVIVYNLVDQTCKVVWNFCEAKNARLWLCGIHKAMDYIESLARVTTGSACS
ncbi:F-box domain-containing protein [Heracleum sosnowskyi]|uniref:F-box domain-containing protein n=1 Tax=Heracleum sosnowskyi TaxID=360622 RepID=A0AAD8GZL3_9APIA|nr:F-box domain-containing protein [Heracleum sosnowskyi]